MFEDNEQIAAAIEDGSYFREGRSWYSTVYMSIISERYFFLVLTSIAVLTSLVAIVAVLRLLPLNPRVPFLYLSHDAYNTIPNIQPIKTERTQDLNDAMRRFYLIQYVERREGYTSRTVDDRISFAQRYSDEETFQRYARSVDLANPRSPVQKLGNLYTMTATVDPDSVAITPVKNTPGAFVASVQFTLDLYSQKLEKEVNSKADISFAYKDLIVDQSKDIHEGQQFHITPMEFKVTNYAVTQLR